MTNLRKFVHVFKLLDILFLLHLTDEHFRVGSEVALLFSTGSGIMIRFCAGAMEQYFEFTWVIDKALSP